MIELLIEGGRRQSLVQCLRELWSFREVVWAFAERNVRLKYKQAVFGVLWAIIQPLSFLAVFVILFERVAGVSGAGISYPAFALAALVPWFFLQSAVSSGASALISEGGLLRKVYFAREAPTLGAILSAGFDFSIGVGLLLVLGPFLGTRLSWATLLAVPLALVLVLLATGVALMFGALNVYYRDFHFLLPLFLQLWLFASPVAYPLATVPERWRLFYLLANPAAGILDGFRRTLALGQPPDVLSATFGAMAAIGIAWAGYTIFKRMEPGFADAI